MIIYSHLLRSTKHRLGTEKVALFERCYPPYSAFWGDGSSPWINKVFFNSYSTGLEIIHFLKHSYCY